MPQMKITRATFVDGKRVEAGAVVTVDERQASNLLAAGKAEADKPTEKKAKPVKAEADA